jgi:hypothetical protein
MPTEHPLIDALHNAAGFRQEQAALDPDDERNARSADMLGQVARLVETLPPGDLRLVPFNAIVSDGVIIGDEQFRRLMGRVGFDPGGSPQSEPYDAARWLDALADDARRVVEDAKRESNEEALDAAILDAEEAAAADGGTPYVDPKLN